MREVNTNRIDPATMDRLAKMYNALKTLCLESARRANTGRVVGFNDMFHDCLLTVAKDDVNGKSDDELKLHVCWRFNMLVFQRTKENDEEIKLILHAND